MSNTPTFLICGFLVLSTLIYKYRQLHYGTKIDYYKIHTLKNGSSYAKKFRVFSCTKCKSTRITEDTDWSPLSNEAGIWFVDGVFMHTYQDAQGNVRGPPINNSTVNSVILDGNEKCINDPNYYRTMRDATAITEN
jgi:hypothetical protein